MRTSPRAYHTRSHATKIANSRPPVHIRLIYQVCVLHSAHYRFRGARSPSRGKILSLFTFLPFLSLVIVFLLSLLVLGAVLLSADLIVVVFGSQ